MQLALANRITLADEADEVITKAKASSSAVRKQIDSLGDGLGGRYEADIKKYLKQESARWKRRLRSNLGLGSDTVLGQGKDKNSGIFQIFQKQCFFLNPL